MTGANVKERSRGTEARAGGLNVDPEQSMNDKGYLGYPLPDWM